MIDFVFDSIIDTHWLFARYVENHTISIYNFFIANLLRLISWKLLLVIDWQVNKTLVIVHQCLIFYFDDRASFFSGHEALIFWCLLTCFMYKVFLCTAVIKSFS